MLNKKTIIAIERDVKQKISHVIRLPKNSNKIPPNIFDNTIPVAALIVNKADPFSLEPGKAPN